MKKKVFAVILAAAAICGSLSPVYAADSELVLYTWEGMFPQEVLDGFEEETGCKIVYSNFDTDETMLEKVSMAKGGDYDVVIADDYILEKIVEEGLATKLDKDKISNWGNINTIALWIVFCKYCSHRILSLLIIQSIISYKNQKHTDRPPHENHSRTCETPSATLSSDYSSSPAVYAATK